MGYWVYWKKKLCSLSTAHMGEIFTPVKAFYLLYPGGFLLSPGVYKHILNLSNIDGVTFWSKGFTAGTNLM